MSADPKRVETIFNRALALDASDREAFLAAECGDDVAVRERVERLLVAHAELGAFLNPLNPVAPSTADFPTDPATAAFGDADNTADRVPVASVGTVIAGKYRLMEEIGEGGMGSVWMAQQTEPVKRFVAVKLIKAGMDSKAVLARFEAERQALALMDHPNIARVLDAGATPDGRPFFVMELVKGVPITKYCDERKLTPRERLELFVPVCQAIQHAHQKGVIHRDIKPSNVLIALYDDRPVPKVIDFGVAKAAGQQLTDKTLATGFGVVVGTPEYMSPEQASFNNLDIDTRSDVYALGVLLYELLAGSPPFARKELEKAGLLEILRVVREVEPPKPSTKLSTADALPTLSANRGTEPKRLTALLRGELDWIVMKALEKDRTRRYETANGFAADVQRYLAGEQVQAVPPSAGYRLKKFFRRNKGPVLAVALVLLALLTGLAGTGVGLIRAERAGDAEAHHRQIAEAAVTSEREQRQLAEKRLIEANAARKAEAAANKDAQLRAAEAKEAMEHTSLFTFFLTKYILAAPRPEGEAFGLGVNVTMAQVLERAEPRLSEVFRGQPTAEALARTEFGTTWLYLGRPAEAERQLRFAIDLSTKALGPDHPTSSGMMGMLGETLIDLGRSVEAITWLEKSIRIHDLKQHPEDPDALATRGTLAAAYMFAGREEEAVKQFEEILPRMMAQFASNDHRIWNVRYNLAHAYVLAGRPKDGVRLLAEVRFVATWLFGPDDLRTLLTISALALALESDDKHTQAIKLIEPVQSKFAAIFGATHPHTLNAMTTLGRAYSGTGNFAKAIPILEEVQRRCIRTLGSEHPNTLFVEGHLAEAYNNSGKVREAISTGEATRAKWAKTRGPDHLSTLRAQEKLATYYARGLQLAKAIDLLEDVRDKQAKVIPADHPRMLTTLNALAQAYREAGRAKEAIPLFEQVRDSRFKIYGPDGKGSLETLSDLAQAYQAAGRPKEAIQLIEPLREKLIATFGPDHYVTLNALSGLAKTYRDLKRFDESIELFKTVRDRRVNQFGINNADALVANNELALAYYCARRFQEEAAVYEMIEKPTIEMYGRDHPNTIVFWLNFAEARGGLGQHELAAKYLREALESSRRAAGNYHPQTETIIRSLTACYNLNGQPGKAEPLLRETCELVKKRNGAESPEYASELAMLGLNLIEQAKNVEVEPIIRECLAIRAKKQPDDWRTFNTRSMLGGSLLAQKKYAEAEPLLLTGYEGMKVREKTIPPVGRARLVEAADRLIVLYRAWGKPGEAAKWRAERAMYPPEQAPMPHEVKR